ncbi:hypothetical protein ACFYYR_19660 [Streptomyces sp. NPDC001922]|uniref:hypothetical protein n=1 Tax=Streptomyces sp. NPDC001922 TaxID=3364624 RepID=UPI003678C692
MSDEPSTLLDARPEVPGAAGPEADGYRNRQHVGQGVALAGGVRGDFHYHAAPEPRDDSVSEVVLRPEFREGPYPPEDVARRLLGFAEPASYARCREVLGHHLLLLGAERGAGAGTTAFALLRERCGADRITGLNSAEDLTAWQPGPGRGYLLRWLAPDLADKLGEVPLRALCHRLREAGSFLVVTVAAELRLPADIAAWQVRHVPPKPYDVALLRLRALAAERRLAPELLPLALEHLDGSEFRRYLGTSPLPAVGVDVAEELLEVVTSGRTVATALENLRLGGVQEAHAALERMRDRADRLALTAAVALLEGLDRTVIEQFAATLRTLFTERAGGAAAGAAPAGTAPAPAVVTPADRPDLLGPAFADRCAEIGARLGPSRIVPSGRYRHRMQPVDFRGRHRAESVLRRLWLEHEGMAELFWTGLHALPHQQGADLAAGVAVGRVLVHATGSQPLRQLHPFAGSDLRWRRRLAAYALGEVAQNAELMSGVQAQLRQWAGVRDVNRRCTVAETCAGSYGLARPAAALNLLDTVVDGPDEGTEPRLRSAVVFALGVLFGEEANHRSVLRRITEWLTAPVGSLRHACAAQVTEALCLSSFPEPHRRATRKLTLADVIGDHPDLALPLVVAALDAPASRTAVAQGLAAVERDPALCRRAAFDVFLRALADASAGHRGVISFLLTRHRNRGTTAPEGKSA